MRQRSTRENRARQISELVQQQGGEAFLSQMYGAFGAVTHEEREAVRSGVRTLCRSGVLAPTDGGNGLYIQRERPPRPAGEKRQQIWDAIMLRHSFTLDDLILLTDCSREYAREYTYSLQAQGFVERQMAGGKPVFHRDGSRGLAVYRPIKRQEQPPPNTGKYRKKGVNV